MYLVFLPFSWNRGFKTLGISLVMWVRGASFVIHSKTLSAILEFVLMKPLGGWGWLLEKPPCDIIRRLELSIPPTPNFQGRERARRLT